MAWWHLVAWWLLLNLLLLCWLLLVRSPDDGDDGDGDEKPD
jgi:hypothetical protein